MRQSFVNEGQRLSVQSALERSQLANSMERMRSNLTNNNTLYLELPKNRRKVTNPELTSLLKRVDPEETCTIPLSNMRKTLTKLLPPKQELARKPKRFTSNSLPSLLTLEQKNELSRYDRARTPRAQRATSERDASDRATSACARAYGCRARIRAPRAHTGAARGRSLS
jgi:hypothetical protein